MTQLSRCPEAPGLLPWVERVWLHASSVGPTTARELCLPSARTRLVLRLQGPAMRSFRALDDRCGVPHSRLQYCGLRQRALLRSTADAGLSVGVDLKPGASLALFGLSADRLAGRHLGLEDLLPADLHRQFAALQGQPAGVALLDRLEDLLLACLMRRDAGGPPPQRWDATLAALIEGAPVLALASASGLSHRAWLQRFRAAVGCTPRAWRELARFSRSLHALRERPGRPLSDLALDLGFHDQAHLSRQFAAHAGMGPAHYRRWGSAWPQHLPLDSSAGPQGSSRCKTEP